MKEMRQRQRQRQRERGRGTATTRETEGESERQRERESLQRERQRERERELIEGQKAGICQRPVKGAMTGDDGGGQGVTDRQTGRARGEGRVGVSGREG